MVRFQSFVRRLAVAAAAGALLGAAEPPVPGPTTPRLWFPLACAPGETCEIQYYPDDDPGPGERDYMCFPRTTDGRHDTTIRLASRVLERAGVDVLAAAAGKVIAVRDGMPDTAEANSREHLIRGRECGNGLVIDHGGGWVTQYCHLQFGSVRTRVQQGQDVAAGAPVGQVGLSGWTEYPHLGFVVRHNDKYVDPFAPDVAAGCGAQDGLWRAEDRNRVAYKRGAFLSGGFSGGMLDMAMVSDGRLIPPGSTAPFLLAFVQVIHAEAGDRHTLTLTRPDGSVLAQQEWVNAKLQAQNLFYVGGRRPPTGWPPGVYRANYRAVRDGATVMERTFEARL